MSGASDADADDADFLEQALVLAEQLSPAPSADGEGEAEPEDGGEGEVEAGTEGGVVVDGSEGEVEGGSGEDADGKA